MGLSEIKILGGIEGEEATQTPLLHGNSVVFDLLPAFPSGNYWHAQRMFPGNSFEGLMAQFLLGTPDFKVGSATRPFPQSQEETELHKTRLSIF